MSPIAPYKLRPVPPAVGILTEGQAVLSPEGTTHALGEEGRRVYASADLVSRLLTHGAGEALCWNHAPIRWRAKAEDGGWRNRPTDVCVVQTPFPPEEEAAAGFGLWREWLAFYGASPTGTVGSATWSLLRATLDRPLWTGLGDRVPVRHVLGGRQEMGDSSAGTHLGSFVHWDLPAAYAHTLGTTRYGGRWARTRPTRAALDGALVEHRPAFVRAVVRVPGYLAFGPLPRRPRRKPTTWESALLPVPYPVGKTLRGTWTWAELAAAESYGCTVRPTEAWIHHTDDRQPPIFAAWWQAVSDGRGLPGFAGALAKMTGNALWGQFCILEGTKEVLTFERGRRRLRGLDLPGAGRPRAPDLAEHVTGSVRASLWELLVRAAARVLSAHTDGGWLVDFDDGWAPRGAWRRKEVAVRIDLLGPQALAYFAPGAASPTYRVAGVPTADAPRVFDELWRARFAVPYPGEESA